MENIEQVKPEPKVVEIEPLKKWKRFLVYLADLFLNFIFCFLLFNLFITPVGKAITGFNTLDKKHEETTEKMYSLLYKNNLVYQSPEFPEYDLADNVDYSFPFFMSYYACDAGTVFPGDSIYKNYENTENISAYFVGYLNDKPTYTAFFKNYNEKSGLFIEDSSTVSGFALKPEVKNQIESYYDVNEVTVAAKNYMETIKSEVYLPLFSELMTTLESKDLTHADVNMTYIECIKEINSLEKYHEVLLSVCSIISYLLGSSIYYFIIPVLTQNKKTLAMLFMRVERIEFSSLNLLSTKHYALSALFNMLLDAVLILFMPTMLVGFSIVFSYSILLYISLVSLAFNITGLLFIIINSHNRSWNDLLNSMVLITSDSLDEIYRSRGYKK